MVAPLALLLELTALFLGIQAATLRTACGLGGAAWLRRRLEAFAQQRRQPLEGQLPVAPLGAMLSGHNPQHPATQLGAQTLLQALTANLSQDRGSLEVKKQLNGCFQLVDVLTART